MTILDTIAEYAATRVEADKKIIGAEDMKALALSGDKARGDLFYENIAKPGISFICEVKKAS
ncbi:MAG: indole-3-glycerol-phosphate synthase TrpC, partial [Lachnospiraceae bacterium]|nr:indole-3-glycerol-phosphate synthase TrpC [Lachnospiraceae bacterium]